MRAIVQKAFERATTLLKQRRDTLEQAAKLLLEHETLDQEQLQPFADRLREPAPARIAVPAA